jgi:hypothetical protein
MVLVIAGLAAGVGYRAGMAGLVLVPGFSDRRCAADGTRRSDIRYASLRSCEWSAVLEAALTATRRDDLQHGTNAAYVRGCVCSECREHQRIWMGGSRG